MNWLDVLILIGLAASVMSGLTKGVVRGVVNLLGVLFGVFMAGRFYEMASGWLGLIHNQNVAHAVAFMAIVIVFMILAGLLGELLHKIISGIMLGWLDHMIGGILGLFIGAVAWGAILALWVKFFSNGAVSGSAIARILLDKFPLVLNLLPGSFDSIKTFFA
jgi:membrane protein required for colicin V production